MRNTGMLFANDANPDRAKAVVGNLHRLGVTNCVVSNYDGRLFPKVSTNLFSVSKSALRVTGKHVSNAVWNPKVKRKPQNSKFSIGKEKKGPLSSN